MLPPNRHDSLLVAIDDDELPVQFVGGGSFFWNTFIPIAKLELV